MSKEEYPIKKFDKLNRLVYVDWNGVERCINIYWEDTKQIKIKYRLWYNDAEVEAYDKKGNVIIKNASGSFVLKLPRLRMENDNMVYKVDKDKILEWKQKLALKEYK